ncbi:mitochondrial genome maintenance exonuclease 1-like [Xenia sp. Carnegie-2017]|uniref:mitochondrial genome maintenance exonuclease 1-like n=1 Tax=Xenia sp. Carnegie-2017 TaxID=2897299 RepID=UPI001F04B071|nr:mitochondrial genome maintenance exonuclease 1-like [Xenia sp. Carnegie-2017]
MILTKNCANPMRILKTVRLQKAFSKMFTDQYNHKSALFPEKWFDSHEIAHMSRRELQKWCKKLGIRANTKTIQMQIDLVNFHKDILSKSDILQHPFLPVQNAEYFTPNLQGLSLSSKNSFNNIWRINSSTIEQTTAGLGQVRHFKVVPNTNDLPEDIFSSQDLVGQSPPKVKGIPSVSKILRNTTPKSKLFAISHWMKKQKALLGEDAFQDKMNNAKRKGTEFHNFIHKCLAIDKLHCIIPERMKGFVESTKDVLNDLTGNIVSEAAIHHPFLHYQGKMDTLALYQDIPCIVEWKTSQHRKKNLDECGDYPIQMVAYAGAINATNKTRGTLIRNCVLVIAYEDGSPADVHVLCLNQCKHFWQDWLLRLHKFHANNLY